MLIEVKNPNIITEEPPKELTPKNVRFYSHHTKQLEHTQIHKAILFVANNCIRYDDFENPLSGGPDGTVDFGAGGGSSVEVTSAMDIKHSGNQSIKINYNAVPGGYMWVARGFDLDATAKPARRK